MIVTTAAFSKHFSFPKTFKIMIPKPEGLKGSQGTAVPWRWIFRPFSHACLAFVAFAGLPLVSGVVEVGEKREEDKL